MHRLSVLHCNKNLIQSLTACSKWMIFWKTILSASGSSRFPPFPYSLSRNTTKVFVISHWDWLMSTLPSDTFTLNSLPTRASGSWYDTTEVTSLRADYHFSQCATTELHTLCSLVQAYWQLFPSKYPPLPHAIRKEIRLRAIPFWWRSKILMWKDATM